MTKKSRQASNAKSKVDEEVIRNIKDGNTELLSVLAEIDKDEVDLINARNRINGKIALIKKKWNIPSSTVRTHRKENKMSPTAYAEHIYYQVAIRRMTGKQVEIEFTPDPREELKEVQDPRKSKNKKINLVADPRDKKEPAQEEENNKE